ncbi:MAG: 50S ribosomal protein L22 [Candidatus Ratteibacteria bacterium]|nr:50S ribosomal protein L22 [Candidatus Ratteibacteria bacterium]
MEARAIARFVRISPRKVRPVINLIRRQNIPKAFEILDSLPQRSSKIVSKVLKSAVANAKQKEKVEDKDLYVSKVLANEGVRWKRIRPRAMGRADRYLKRTSHISVIICTSSKLKAKSYGTKSKS